MILAVAPVAVLDGAMGATSDRHGPKQHSAQTSAYFTIPPFAAQSGAARLFDALNPRTFYHLSTFVHIL